MVGYIEVRYWKTILKILTPLIITIMRSTEFSLILNFWFFFSLIESLERHLHKYTWKLELHSRHMIRHGARSPDFEFLPILLFVSLQVFLLRWRLCVYRASLASLVSLVLDKSCSLRVLFQFSLSDFSAIDRLINAIVLSTGSWDGRLLLIPYSSHLTGIRITALLFQVHW